MRHIGNLTSESHVQTFRDVLATQGIRHEIERDGDSWIVWIHDEERVAAGQELLQRFLADPEAEAFRAARGGAERASRAEQKELEDYRKRLRTRQSLFPKLGGYGVGPFTFVLICLCLVVAVYSKLGDDREAVTRLVMASPENANGTFLPEIRAGQYWRLLSPALLHFGILHILFNLMWLYQLGSMIEARRGTLTLLLLFIVTAIFPIMAEYVWHGPRYVGGMSGVIYGLAGYVWMQGKHNRASGLFLDPTSIQWLLIWLVVCFTGIVGPVANLAHLAGLVIGMIWGRLAAWFAERG